MQSHNPTREEALTLLREYTSNESLVKHALAVEGVMRHMAVKKGGDPDEWGIIGLIHDLDYEKYPQEHCVKTKEILTAKGWPEHYIRAAVSHGWGVCGDVEPKSDLEKTLYAVDELTGLVTACALVRPSRSVSDLEPKSVRKKWKQPSFAAGVNREIIENGARIMGMETDLLIAEVIAGMRGVASNIGL